MTAGRPATPHTDSRPRCARVAIAAASLCAALSLSACGAEHDVIFPASTRAFPLLLNAAPDANHAALQEALDRGYFRQAGLEVQLRAPAQPANVLSELAEDHAEMAISSEPEVLLARDRGLALVSVAALVQRPLSALMSLASRNIRGFAGLAGRRVGVSDVPYQTALLGSTLRRARVAAASVRQVPMAPGALAGALASGRVEAVFGAFTNTDALRLQQLHRTVTVIPVEQGGTPEYNELVLVVRAGTARFHGEELRAFLQALTRGQRAVAADPAQAAADLADGALNSSYALQSVKLTLEAAAPSEAGAPFGWQSPTQWSAFGSWMLSGGLISHNPSAGLPPFTNEFLPGQGI